MPVSWQKKNGDYLHKLISYLYVYKKIVKLSWNIAQPYMHEIKV